MAFENIGQIACAAINCTSPLGAAAEQLQFCQRNISQSEVNTLICWHPTLGTPIANWPASGETGLVALDFDIDNTDATDVKQKQFFGVGSVADPEENTIEVNDGQTYVLNRTRTLTFNIYQMPIETYNWLRELQCGTVKPKFVYGDRANYLYGIDGGLVASNWTVAFPKDSGADAVNRATLTITFDGKTDPDRAISPL